MVVYHITILFALNYDSNTGLGVWVKQRYYWGEVWLCDPDLNLEEQILKQLSHFTEVEIRKHKAKLSRLQMWKTIHNRNNKLWYFHYRFSIAERLFSVSWSRSCWIHKLVLEACVWASVKVTTYRDVVQGGPTFMWALLSATIISGLIYISKFT